MNIPIYRAKTIKQDYNEWEECEQLKKINGYWYAIGFYDCKREIKTYLGDWEITHLILIRKSTSISEVSTAEIIDISTLAIHFPDMIDNQGNKIFASLSEDGKGGSRLECSIILRKEEFIYNCTAIYRDQMIKTTVTTVNRAVSKQFKVIGIQE